MPSPNEIVSALGAAGFTHLVWIPDSHLGTWEPALAGSPLAPVRVCREGEAIGVAIGLLLGGAKPLIAIQCTGFFEAGDAVRNAVHDMKLPLKLLIGVRGARAAKSGTGRDNCPHFAQKLVDAWELPHAHFDPVEPHADLSAALQSLTQAGPRALLWSE